MSRNIVKIQIFVSSPSDLNEEREILESLVLELNKTWSSSLGLVFELIRWEKDVRPMAGKDTQLVINSQIPQNYDVFLGMLWGRFGTPTPRAASGTLEEFKDAMRRFELSSGNNPEIMLYFKDAPISPSKIDPEQIRKIKDFKRSISSTHVFSTFESKFDFQNLVRAHLASLAQSFMKKLTKADVLSEEVSFESKIDDLGYLDYSDMFSLKMGEAQLALEVIGKETRDITKKINDHANAIRNSNMQGYGSSQLRVHLNSVADDLTSYSSVIRTQKEILSASQFEAMDALTKSLVLHEDFDRSNNDLNSLKDSMVSARDSMVYCISSWASMCESINKLPRATVELNRSKRLALKELGELIAEMKKIRQALDELIDTLLKMIAVKR